MRRCAVLFLLLSSFAARPQHVLHGRIYAAGPEQQALGGVIIRNLHTSDTTPADSHGNFLLPFASAGQLLEFSLRGYRNVRVRVHPGSDTLAYRIIMTPSTAASQLPPEPFKICTFPGTSDRDRGRFRKEQ